MQPSERAGHRDKAVGRSYVSLGRDVFKHGQELPSRVRLFDQTPKVVDVVSADDANDFGRDGIPNRFRWSDWRQGRKVVLPPEVRGFSACLLADRCAKLATGSGDDSAPQMLRRLCRPSLLRFDVSHQFDVWHVLPFANRFANLREHFRGIWFAKQANCQCFARVKCISSAAPSATRPPLLCRDLKSPLHLRQSTAASAGPIRWPLRRSGPVVPIR